MYAHFQSGLKHGRFLAALLAVAAAGSLASSAADAPATTTTTTAPASSSASPAASGNTAANSDAQSSLTGDLSTLEYVLSLPPQRLAALRKALENVEKMPQGERDALRLEIQNRRQNLDQLRREIAGDLQLLSPADRSVLQQYQLTLYTNEIQALGARFHTTTTPEERKKIIEELLKTATEKGIKPMVNDRGPQVGGSRGNQTPGGRGGRGGPGASGDNGRGGPRSGDTSHQPMPGPAPIPLPAQ